MGPKKNAKKDTTEKNSTNYCTLQIGEGCKRATVSDFDQAPWTHLNDWSKGKSISFNYVELISLKEQIDVLLYYAHYIYSFYNESKQEEGYHNLSYIKN